MAKTKKNASNKKKLLSAVSMLTVSAVMLSTATYAWFTMSREVEVKNIQMMATTPEDIQLSLGEIGTANNAPETKGTGKSLKNSTGVLVKADGAANANDGQVMTPSADKAWNWSNTADLSKYYAIGKLIPASSTTGTNVYFTPDADGVGKTISSGAQFIQADADTANAASGAVATGSGASGDYKARLYARTTEGESWSGTRATAYNATYDDGYYVDIPVWLRTSSTEGCSLGVTAYVVPMTATSGTATPEGEALYRAVRVAILDGSNTGNAAKASGTTNLLPVHDGQPTLTSGTAGTKSASPFTGDSILNWYGSGTDGKLAAKATGTASSRFDSAIYEDSTEYDGTSAFVKLTKGTGAAYGPATQVIIRVWLEGEDPDCWNETAGQDWSINLKFFKAGTTPSATDIESTQNN